MKESSFIPHRGLSSYKQKRPQGLGLGEEQSPPLQGHWLSGLPASSGPSVSSSVSCPQLLFSLLKS